MRQAVDHPYLIVYSKTRAQKLGNLGSAPVANGSVECDICHELPTGRVLSTCCGAGFCRSCVIEYIQGAGGESTLCPSCRAPFSVDLNQVFFWILCDFRDEVMHDAHFSFASFYPGELGQH